MRFSQAICLLMACSPSMAVLGPFPAYATDGNHVVGYPRAPGDDVSRHFPVVKVNGVLVDTIGTDMNVAYAHFAFSGAAKVEVIAREPIDSADLSPHRDGIRTTVQGNLLSFELQEPRYLHLKINDLQRLFLLADAPEEDVPKLGDPAVFDVRDWGIASSMALIQTEQFQVAMNEVAERRGILFVPPGIYRCGQLQMRSNLTLYLAAGAMIQGTGREEDYPQGELGSQQIYWLDCEHSHIMGRGVIDGHGQTLRLNTGNSSSGRLKLLRALRARECSLSGVILRNPGTWTVHLAQSQDLLFDNFKLMATTRIDVTDFPWELNTDGFDPDNSSRITIENGFVSCNDDAIAVKLRTGELRDMDDIRFRNNVIWTVKSALKIGTEVNARRITNVVFEDNDVIRADRGIAAYCYGDAKIEKPRWSDNHFEFIGGDLKQMNIDINMKNGQGAGKLRGLEIVDNTFERASPEPCRLDGLDEAHPVDGVLFGNLVIEGEKRMSLHDANIKANEFVRNVKFR